MLKTIPDELVARLLTEKDFVSTLKKDCFTSVQYNPNPPYQEDIVTYYICLKDKHSFLTISASRIEEEIDVEYKRLISYLLMNL